MTILHFLLHILLIFSSWVDPLVFIGFSLIWRWFSILFIVFLLYGTTESYNATLVERHGFQEKNAYRLRNLGGILTLFIQSWIPFKKIRDGIQWFFIFKMLFIIFQWFFIFKMCFIIFDWCFNVVTCVSLFFSVFSVF